MIIELKHCNYGLIGLNLAAITEVAVPCYSARRPSVNTEVAFGSEDHPWAFTDDHTLVLRHLKRAGIRYIPATCARDRHGDSTWLMLDHIFSAKPYGDDTTDLKLRWGRTVSLHEPYADFMQRWRDAL